MFAQDPDFGGVLKSWHFRVPSWHYLDRYRPAHVRFKAFEDSTGDPYFYPAKRSYREYFNLYKRVAKLPDTGEPAILPCNLSLLIKLRDSVTYQRTFDK